MNFDIIENPPINLGINNTIIITTRPCYSNYRYCVVSDSFFISVGFLTRLIILFLLLTTQWMFEVFRFPRWRSLLLALPCSFTSFCFDLWIILAITLNYRTQSTGVRYLVAQRHFSSSLHRPEPNHKTRHMIWCYRSHFSAIPRPSFVSKCTLFLSIWTFTVRVKRTFIRVRATAHWLMPNYNFT